MHRLVRDGCAKDSTYFIQCVLDQRFELLARCLPRAKTSKIIHNALIIGPDDKVQPLGDPPSMEKEQLAESQTCQDTQELASS